MRPWRPIMQPVAAGGSTPAEAGRHMADPDSPEPLRRDADRFDAALDLVDGDQTLLRMLLGAAVHCRLSPNMTGFSRLSTADWLVNGLLTLSRVSSSWSDVQWRHLAMAARCIWTISAENLSILCGFDEELF
jgi:hypothetical protein